MESKSEDLPAHHAVLENNNDTKVKTLPIRGRRRRQLSLTSQSSNVISSGGDDLNSCPVKVKPEKNGPQLTCHRKDTSSSLNSMGERIEKCEDGPPFRTLRSKTPVEYNKNQKSIAVDEEIRKWTEAEKSQLIGILKNEGYDGNMQKIAAKFPRHTVNSVRHLLLTVTNPPKEEWEKKLDNYIKIFKNDYGRQNSVANCPRFVDAYSKFGKHPCPSTAGGVDYALLYQSIVYFMHGGIPKLLDERSRAKLYLLVQKLRTISRERRKYSIPDEDLPQNKETRTREDRNEDLANRRRNYWSEAEMAARTNVLSKDINVVRKFFVSHDCFNPFRLSLEKDIYSTRLGIQQPKLFL